MASSSKFSTPPPRHRASLPGSFTKTPESTASAPSVSLPAFEATPFHEQFLQISEIRNKLAVSRGEPAEWKISCSVSYFSFRVSSQVLRLWCYHPADSPVSTLPTTNSEARTRAVMTTRRSWPLTLLSPAM